MSSYYSLTKKQANTIYKLLKQDLITVEKHFMDIIYDLVGKPWRSCTVEERKLITLVEDVIDHCFHERYDIAQALIDGKTVTKENVVVDVITRYATEDDFFYEPGEQITEEILEPRWVISD